jgi:hypothetical protein
MLKLREKCLSKFKKFNSIGVYELFDLVVVLFSIKEFFTYRYSTVHDSNPVYSIPNPKTPVIFICKTKSYERFVSVFFLKKTTGLQAFFSRLACISKKRI